MKETDIVLAFLLVVVVIAVAAATFLKLPPDFGVENTVRGQYIERSSGWCDKHNGTLSNHMVVGKHGGLHCNLPDGRGVHMSAVAATGYSDNISRIKREFRSQPSPMDTVLWIGGATLAATLIVQGIREVRRD